MAASVGEREARPRLAPVHYRCAVVDNLEHDPKAFGVRLLHFGLCREDIAARRRSVPARGRRARS